METSDQEKFANSLGVLCEIFDKQISPIVIRAYFQALKPYPVEEVESVISQAIVSCKFFPRPVELIQLIAGNPEDLADRAEVEASKVLRAVKYEGAYKSIQFGDPVTAAVIQQGFGGWIRLCEDLKASEEKWFRKDFCQIYGAYARQGVTYNGHLAGLIEADNTTRGFTDSIPEPVLIGDAGEIKRINMEVSK